VPTMFAETCSKCKLRNKPGAFICQFCGAALQGPPQETFSTNKLDDSEEYKGEKAGPFVDSLVPPQGMGIYLEDTTRVTIFNESEATLGRRAEGTAGFVIDLVPHGAFSLGVSRRHARLLKTSSGYAIMDLHSTNGTWVNHTRLEPEREYPLSNGDILRLGHLRLLLLFRKQA